MKKEKIQLLMKRCKDFFREKCYTEGRISKYESLWRTGIVRFMTNRREEYYSPEVGRKYCATCSYNGTVRHQEREHIRSVQVLDDMLELGYIRRRCYIQVHHSLDGKIGLEMEKFVAHITNLRRSQKTINDYRLYLSEFLSYLTMNHVEKVNEITEQHIISFVSSLPTNKVNVISSLRVLFRFWMEEHIVVNKFHDLFDSFKIRRRERIPSFFTPQQVKCIEQSVSRSSGVGKRDYAMVLLASRLGLRASDIANLRFSSIDWERNLIRLCMQKTGKTIELPLLADVGNAIVDYLRYGRPISDLKHVFISSRAPYVSASKNMVSNAINRIICASGVDITGKHHGPHSLRHSLASAMLNDGTTIPVISESLGHQSSQSTLTYLKIDISHLRQCALPVPSVSDEFYMQRGGAFYG